jgi:hypothetical protein
VRVGPAGGTLVGSGRRATPSQDGGRLAVAVALLGVSRLASARPAVHGPVPTVLTNLGSRGGIGGPGAGRTSGRGHRCSSDCGCLTTARAAGYVTCVPGFTYRPLGVELAHRRFTSSRLRHLTDTASPPGPVSRHEKCATVSRCGPTLAFGQDGVPIHDGFLPAVMLRCSVVLPRSGRGDSPSTPTRRCRRPTPA